MNSDHFARFYSSFEMDEVVKREQMRWKWSSNHDRMGCTRRGLGCAQGNLRRERLGRDEEAQTTHWRKTVSGRGKTMRRRRKNE